MEPKPNSCVREPGLGRPAQRNLCVHTQYKQQVMVRMEIQVSIFMVLMDTCHTVTINTSVPLFSKWKETLFILLAFDQVKKFSNPVTFLLCMDLIKVTLDNIMVGMF